MLRQRKNVQGVSLIELAIGLAIFSLLIAIAAPSFSTWMQNSKIRTTAESIQNALQLARAEAVRRNTPVRFQLTSSVTDDCAVSTTGTSWVISQRDPGGSCASAPSDTAADPDPLIIQARSGAAGASNATVAMSMAAPATTPTFIAFNGLGRVTPNPGGDVSIDVQNPAGGACATNGPMRCLRVVVSAFGQVRMCDPARSGATPPDPQGC